MTFAKTSLNRIDNIVSELTLEVDNLRRLIQEDQYQATYQDRWKAIEDRLTILEERGGE